MYLTKKQVTEFFKNEIVCNISFNDKPAITEAWIIFTDNLIRDKQVRKSAKNWTVPTITKKYFK